MNTHQNDPRVFHETIVRDTVDLIIDGAKNFNDVDAIQPFGKAKKSFRAITKASSKM